MSENWQAGDLALCIGRDPHGVTFKWSVEIGCIYTVCDVGEFTFGGTWLDFEEDQDFQPDAGWDASFFRKVTPPTPDEFDRETIELMNRKPAKVPA